MSAYFDRLVNCGLSGSRCTQARAMKSAFVRRCRAPTSTTSLVRLVFPTTRPIAIALRRSFVASRPQQPPRWRGPNMRSAPAAWRRCGDDPGHASQHVWAIDQPVMSVATGKTMATVNQQQHRSTKMATGEPTWRLDQPMLATDQPTWRLDRARTRAEASAARSSADPHLAKVVAVFHLA